MAGGGGWRLSSSLMANGLIDLVYVMELLYKALCSENFWLANISTCQEDGAPREGMEALCPLFLPTPCLIDRFHSSVSEA